VKRKKLGESSDSILNDIWRIRRNPMAKTRRKPHSIIAKKYGRFIHETITPKTQFPRGTKYRTITTNTHRVVIGYWGKPVAGKHPYYGVQKILHPKRRGEPCRLKDRLRVAGVTKLLLGREYRVGRKLPKLTGKRRGGRLTRRNPRSKWYVGIAKKPFRKISVFSHFGPVTRSKFGAKYFYAYGPFKSREEAERYGRHVST
jgi:hypothetical protein